MPGVEYSYQVAAGTGTQFGVYSPPLLFALGNTSFCGDGKVWRTKWELG